MNPGPGSGPGPLGPAPRVPRARVRPVGPGLLTAALLLLLIPLVEGQQAGWPRLVLGLLRRVRRRRRAAGRLGVAVAFSHSAELALLVNVGFVVLALVLVLALPRRIPGR